MNRREFENMKKGNLENMKLEDWTEAMKHKEDIWQSLDINQGKKKPSKKWLLWFLLGFLIALSGSFLINKFISQEKSENVIMASLDLVDENEQLKNNLEHERQEIIAEIRSKNQLIDSINNVNRSLNEQLMKLINNSNQNTVTQPNMIYVRDTIYMTEVIAQEVIKEKIIRDTVWLNKPLDDPELNLIADNTDVNGTSKSDVESASQEKKRRTKRKSIQFNFSEIESERD